MRESGLTRLIEFCGEYKCAHSVIIGADRWADDVRLSDLEPLFVCKASPGTGSFIPQPEYLESLQPPFPSGLNLTPSQSLGLLTGQTLIELEYGGAFVDGDLPVLLIPTRVIVWTKNHIMLRRRPDKTDKTPTSIRFVGFVSTVTGLFSIFLPKLVQPLPHGQLSTVRLGFHAYAAPAGLPPFR
jgi:hypothetical protein